MQKSRIAVLGAGMVGRTIALDLAKVFEVTSFDLSQQNLLSLKNKENKIHTVVADLSRYDNYSNLLEGFDLVITAVPGFMGFDTLKAAIACGKNIVDISFFPEDALSLNELAIQQNVTVITDCGVAPGMSNFIIGRYNELMKIDSFECYVGGLPQYRKPPFEYKAPFSPIDVIEEYTRPARMVENGEIVIKPALSEKELIDFGGIDASVGILEAFNTDGLRSLIHTMGHIPNLKEKTLRYPGHIELIETMKRIGLFSEMPVRVKDQQIRPIDFSTAMLLEDWKLGEDEPELTIMQVTVRGNGKAITYSMIDRYDTETGTSSMSRTTGYTCTAAANLILNGHFNKKGVFPPELVGSDANCFNFVLQYLADRKVKWIKEER